MVPGPIGWVGKPSRLPTWKGAPASVESRAFLRPLAVGQGLRRRHRTQCRHRYPARVRDGAAALLGPCRRRRARDAAPRAPAHRHGLLPHRPPRAAWRAGGAALCGHGLERGVHVVRGGDRGHRDGAASPREDGARRHRVRRSESGTRRFHPGPRGMADGARGDLAPGPKWHSGGTGARLRESPRRVWRHPHASGQHSRQDADTTPVHLHGGPDRRGRAGHDAGRDADAALMRGRGRLGASRGAGAVSQQLDVRLVKRLPGFTLDVTWSAGEGVAALFGPSGAGKTLTLQCLSGLLRPDAGRVVVGDRVLFDAAAGINVPPQQRGLGYVFQGYALFPHLTVADNIAFGLRGRPRAEAARRTAEVIERMSLGGLEDRRPHEISGGLRQSLREELAGILSDWHVAAVLVTHDFQEAYRLGDQIVVYEAGQVIQAAPRSELLWRPASERVAGILGIRNVLRGSVVKASHDRIQFRWRGQILEAVNSPARSYLPEPDSSLAFFIRPEYVRLIRKDRGTTDSHHMNLLSGEIVREADFGTTYTLYVRLDNPGRPAQGDYDLEVEVPRLVYEILEIGRDRRWQLSMHRGSIQILPGSLGAERGS